MSRTAPAPPASDSRAQRSDIVRQVAVIAAVVFMLVAAMVGIGLFGGTNVRDLQGGALDSDATILAPGRSAFGIWSVIYALTIAYAVWQALPRQRARERQRAAGWWIALSAIVNGLWLVCAQFLTLPLTVLALGLLVVVLAVALRSLIVRPAAGIADALLLDGAVGLHLGWASLASVANVTAWLQYGAGVDAPDPVVWGVAVLVIVAALGVALAWGTGGRIAPGLAMGWGLFWIGMARALDEPRSLPVAIAAWIAAAVVLVAPVAVRTVRRRAAARD